MNRLPGEQDCGQANGWGHSVSIINTISSFILYYYVFFKKSVRAPDKRG